LNISSKQKQNIIIEVNRLAKNKKKQVYFSTKKDLFLWENNELYKLNKKNYQYELIYSSNIVPLSIECKKFISLIKRKKLDYSNPLRAIEILSVLKKIK